jgi:hypothetical protein
MILNGNGRQLAQAGKVRDLRIDQRGAAVPEPAQRLGDNALDVRVKPAEPVLPVEGELDAARPSSLTGVQSPVVTESNNTRSRTVRARGST